MSNRAWLAALLALSACAQASGAEIERSFYLMGTSLDARISAASREQALGASEAMLNAVQAAERRLSTWVDDSELARLNRAPVGRVVALSPLLERDLRNAYRYGQETGFAFTPWIGPLVRAWGLRSGGRIPSAGEIKEARLASRPDAFRWSASGIARQDLHALVEEGGFGKGVGLDDALDALRAGGVKNAVLNFGGQLSVLGEGKVPVEVSDPSDRAKTLLRFVAPEGSVSTSGNSEHGIRVEARRVGHILNPKTGRPAAYDGSVTVLAPSGVEADSLSTALFVMGAERGLAWARTRSKQALWILPGSRPGTWIARTSCGWLPKLEKISDRIEIRPDCGSKE